MDFLILGFIFIQLLLEVLPISSSAHLALFESFKQFEQHSYLSAELRDALEHFLLGPTFFVLAFFFYPQWNIFLAMVNPFSSMRSQYRKKLFFITLKIGILTVAATLITTLLYGIVRVALSDVPLLTSPLTRAAGLCITALLLASTRFIHYRAESLNFSKALLLGLTQGLALLPGISRLASTYTVSCLLGISARRSFQISWILYSALALPSCVKGTYELYLLSWWPTISWGPLLLTILSGMLLSLLLLIFVSWCVKRSRIWIFSFYMIIPFLLTCALYHFSS